MQSSKVTFMFNPEYRKIINCGKSVIRIYRRLNKEYKTVDAFLNAYNASLSMSIAQQWTSGWFDGCIYTLATLGVDFYGSCIRFVDGSTVNFYAPYNVDGITHYKEISF